MRCKQFLLTVKMAKKNCVFFSSKINRTLERIVWRINVEFYYLFYIHSSTAVTKFLDSYYSFFRMCFFGSIYTYVEYSTAEQTAHPFAKVFLERNPIKFDFYFFSIHSYIKSCSYTACVRCWLEKETKTETIFWFSEQKWPYFRYICCIFLNCFEWKMCSR